jgi:hypothetical protein
LRIKYSPISVCSDYGFVADGVYVQEPKLVLATPAALMPTMVPDVTVPLPRPNSFSTSAMARRLGDLRRLTRQAGGVDGDRKQSHGRSSLLRICDPKDAGADFGAVRRECAPDFGTDA